jgi:N6-L-threonylcarbamoyladenine synthase
MVEGSPGGLILGIESSCDETAAAVVRAGGEMLANVVASQMKLHANYGGVVPELASREHLRNIVPVVRAAMERAAEVEPGLTFQDLDAIAVTEGPGLAGALLVGITYAKALALGVGKPLVAVNHLEGHIHAVLMEARQREQAMEMPLLALVVSGGHTHLYLAELGGEAKRNTEILSEAQNDERGVGHPGTWRYRNVGRTVDDAAGEAFDKVAKLLGLGYPGGPAIDRVAKNGNDRAIALPTTRLTHADRNAPELKGDLDFSFSGLKTAVLRHVRTSSPSPDGFGGASPPSPDGFGAASALTEAEIADIAASFQRVVVTALVERLFDAARRHGARSVGIAGGVSANSRLRAELKERGERRELPTFLPSLALSTDNAAMIAAAGLRRFRAGHTASLDLNADAALTLS